MHIDTQKTSVGMYSECDYRYKSCFGDYLVTLIAKFGESGRSVATYVCMYVAIRQTHAH